jgi:hypothetical protein
MYKLNKAKQAQIISALVEGNSLAAWPLSFQASPLEIGARAFRHP